MNDLHCFLINKKYMYLKYNNFNTLRMTTQENVLASICSLPLFIYSPLSTPLACVFFIDSLSN